MSLQNKHYITARQIKAARALLDWSQEDLAAAAELSVATIRKIETGSLSPRDKTMGSIFGALESVGVEFSGSSGVKLTENDTMMIEGEGCFIRLLDEIYHELRKSHGEVLSLYAEFTRSDEAELQSIARMKKEGIRFRFLLKEGDTHIPLPLEEVRLIPEKYFQPSLEMIYGDFVAHCLFSGADMQKVAKIIIVRDKHHAEATRHAFNFIWDNCRKPTITTAPDIYT